MMFWRGRDRKDDGGGSKPRPRVRPIWRRTWAVSSLSAAAMAFLAGTGWWVFSAGHVDTAVEKVRWSAISATATMGFEVREVMVSGRHKTDRNELIEALNVARGAPILAFDIDTAKARLDSLPWVRASTIERMLPDTILVSIVEREPLVLWQLDGKLRLIDAEGSVILDRDLEPYAELMVVVGTGAEMQAADLLAILGTQPDLMNQVKAASWVGNRRWNLHLDGGIDVRLPEDNPAGAWSRLAKYHKSHRVLEKDVKVLDLRIPDRLIVKQGPKDDGQQT